MHIFEHRERKNTVVVLILFLNIGRKYVHSPYLKVIYVCYLNYACTVKLYTHVSLS